MNTKQITFVLTSCGRFKSLKKTIQSIEKSIDLSLYEKILTEDSKDNSHIQLIKKANKNGFLKGWKIIYTGGSNQKDIFKRHFYALKTLYKNINTKYVFHCEDDQIFKETNYNYIDLSYKILEKENNIALILLRDLLKDFGLKKTGIMKSRYYEILTDEEKNYFGHEFIFLNKNESFTLQAGLRRTNLMKKVMFGFEDYVNERLVSERLSNLGYRSIVLKNGIFNHIDPKFNSTKNIKNMGFFRYITMTLKGTIRYRFGLIYKYIKYIFTKK